MSKYHHWWLGFFAVPVSSTLAALEVVLVTISSANGGRLTGVVAAMSFFSIGEYNNWLLNRQGNTHYGIYHSNEMFIATVWLVMLYIDHHLKVFVSYRYWMYLILWIAYYLCHPSGGAVFALGTLFEANRINAGVWCWWNIDRCVLVKASC